MKFEPVTKINKRNTATSKKFSDGVIPASCDVIVTFPIYGQFGAIRKPKVIFYITKTESRTKKSLTQLSYYCFE